MIYTIIYIHRYIVIYLLIYLSIPEVLKVPFFSLQVPVGLALGNYALSLGSNVGGVWSLALGFRV